MMQDTTTEQTVQNSTEEKEDFINRLVWREGNKSKWYLDKRECFPIEGNDFNDVDIISIDSGVFDGETDEANKIKECDTVFSELGKLVVAKVEENQAFLQIESDQVPVPLETVKKVIKVNILILGKTKSFLMENLEVQINEDVSMLKRLIADYIAVPTDILQLHLKEKALTEENTYIHTLDLSEGDTLMVSFTQNEEMIYKRSGSKDYTWNDQKNVIPFTVDRNIVASAFGFFRNYDAPPAIYDFFIYEILPDGSKVLVTQMSNVTVLSSEVDANYVKRVSCAPIVLKADVKYRAYVYYKVPEMRTYYAYCGTADQTVYGVKFLITEFSEEGHRSSSTSGHMPYIYFKIYNPYEN